jgi:hypothetical protein
VTAVAELYKVTAPAPEVVEEVEEPIPQTYGWEASDFPACPLGCGSDGSMLQRPVECVASVKLVRVGVAPDAARCTAARPVDLKICAATAACVSYGWEAPGFSDCPSGCGIPEIALNRAVVCMGSDRRVASEEAASCRDTKPAASTTCAATAACVTYSWDAADFAVCPSECGQLETVSGPARGA